MLEVYVCIGTSCHLRGADRVVEQLTTLLAENEIQDRVQVKGSFCLDHCSEGVSVKVGDRVLEGVLPSNVRERVLPDVLVRARPER